MVINRVPENRRARVGKPNQIKLFCYFLKIKTIVLNVLLATCNAFWSVGPATENVLEPIFFIREIIKFFNIRRSELFLVD